MRLEWCLFSSLELEWQLRLVDRDGAWHDDDDDGGPASVLARNAFPAKTSYRGILGLVGCLLIIVECACWESVVKQVI